MRKREKSTQERGENERYLAVRMCSSSFDMAAVTDSAAAPHSADVPDSAVTEAAVNIGLGSGLRFPPT